VGSFLMRRWVGGFLAVSMGGWFLDVPVGESCRYRGVWDQGCGAKF
jgi:hypothetical protein